MSVQPDYVSILPGKTKNSTKTADRLSYYSAFFRTDRSKLSQKVLQYVPLFPCLLENSFSSFLTKNLHSHRFLIFLYTKIYL